MIKNIVLVTFVAVLLVGCKTTNINEITVEPRGEFTEIDVQAQNETIKKLLKLDEEAVASVKTSPEKFNPPVLYAMSYALFNLGHKDESGFWFYSGQLKARSDANKAQDVSARQAVDVLNKQYGPPINQHMFQNIDLLKETVAKVVETDKVMLRDYDPRWISLHGLDAFEKTTVRFAPKDQWEAINEKTRKEYMAGFKKAVGS